MVAQLGQRLRGRQAYAGGDARPAQDALAHGKGPAREVTDAVQIPDKAFIDGVNLLQRPQARGNRHHAGAHVAVQLKVGGQAHQLRHQLQAPELEIGLAHLDAHGLGLVRAGDGAAIVVAQHHHRQAAQARAEGPLAGHVEVVAVDEGEHGASPGEAFDAGSHHAPDFQRLVFLGHDVRIGGVAGLQAHHAAGGEQELDRELAIHRGHHDVRVARRD